MSARSEFADALAAAWADIPALAGVRVVATERELDVIDRPTFVIRSKSIARSPEAPISHRDIGLLGSLISPHVNLDIAQDQLDDLVDAVLDHLDTFCRHGDATTAAWNDSRLAFDIPITILASKE
jgi:hypothetical protein